MNRSKLKSRLHFVPASSLPKRATSSSFSKRSPNHVQEESHPNDLFVDFFDYEDDLSEMVPSNELFVEDRGEEGRFLFNEEPDRGNFGIVLEEIDVGDDIEKFDFETEVSRTSSDFLDDKVESEANFFEISDNYCIYHLNSGKRCENSKEEGSLFCLAHQQL